ncbi:hypothetical protein FLO80_15480 [Aquicoccus porphyridii]|uniref:Uncharacterized protein n=1 Tax=Aquicoccus porphyridii TaxID=1852029 RepID=A0A5A9Z5J6_9RHOB|nr:hypothetical protein [Aquicoccus porphyridii]KAA0912466.1 hypothetical protein FLO80_15480 [Aquicoccus porphyridii]RAI53146.1 hypothetical protein DOO74_14785 [Rhodobacteraceae bacterium AsT-22]
MIIVAGLILAFILILIFSNRTTRHCRWRAQGVAEDGARDFRCMACGARTTTPDGSPPKVCLRPDTTPRA